jgi:hypothetical protein
MCGEFQRRKGKLFKPILQSLVLGLEYSKKSYYKIARDSAGYQQQVNFLFYFISHRPPNRLE